ncbi:cystatin-1-like [Hydra vulgaris]|uniref:cystatin-1-like n=1 Tax=Hydra vulgaris TaxID=6087 RepID=UPI0002B4A387|nr:cystatin-1-like [Hydra vulgaris]
MNSVIVFIALIGLTFGLPRGKVQLTEKQIEDLVSKNGPFSVGLNVAIGKLNYGSSKYRQVREKIINATSQIVAGTQYEVNIKVVESVCENLPINSNLMTTKECPVKEKPEAKVCKVSIWYRPFLIQTMDSLVVNTSCKLE